MEARPTPDDLILDNLPMAVAIARDIGRTVPPHQRGELRSAAFVGLIEAARRFDPDRGCFSVFARHRIAGAVRDELRESDPLSRLDREKAKQGINVLPVRLEPLTPEIETSRPTHEASPEALAMRAEKQRQAEAALELALAELSERYRQLIRWYYDVDGLTMRQISLRLGVNESRICQMHKYALFRLRKVLQSNEMVCSLPPCNPSFRKD